jgi:hypothetical protein
VFHGLRVEDQGVDPVAMNGSVFLEQVGDLWALTWPGSAGAKVRDEH